MRAFRSTLGAITSSLVLLVPACSSAPLLRGEEVPFAEDTGRQPPACQAQGIKKLATGTRPDWHPDGRIIGYDAPVNGTNPVNGTHEVFLVNADGSDGHCITCSSAIPPELRGKHKGKTTFHPGGKYVLFGAENEHGNHGPLTTPGIGVNNDFWVTDLAVSGFWRLTRLPKGSALQYPRFSPDGRQLLWSERYEAGHPFTKGDELGHWRMHIADFVVGADGPHLANITDLEPGGRGYYEPHGFSPDGRKIIFTGMIRPGKSQMYGEIYTYDLATRTLTNLAQADKLHFEQALYSPSGHRIAFMSGPFIGALRFAYRSDLYLMDADGKNRVRLTYFNTSGHPESTGTDTLIDKDVWSPDGTKLALGTFKHKLKELAVLLLTFQGPCGKV